MVNHGKQKIVVTYLHLLMLMSMMVPILAIAQKRATVHGYVLDSINYSPVANAQVTNTNNRLQQFLSDIGAPKQPAASTANSGAGLGINLDFLTKKEKSKRKAYKLYNEHEKDAYLNYRFSPETVSEYTGLKDDTLKHFMQLYTPDYDWLRQHTENEDIFYYLNDKLRLFYRRERK